jgi:TolA-binding protein
VASQPVGSGCGIFSSRGGRFARSNAGHVRRGWGSALGVAGFLVLAGCAPETSPLLRDDVARLRTDLLRIEQTLQRFQAEVKAELGRSDRQTAQTLTEIQRSVAQLGARFDELGRDTGQLQGRLDSIRQRLDALALHVEVGGGMPRTPRAPADPGHAGPSPTTPPTSATSPPSSAPPAPGTSPASGMSAAPADPGGRAPDRPSAAAGPAREAVELYQTAYIDYTRGNYNLAITAFQEYIRRYPSTDLAEKAQYWIAESHFSLAKSHQARGEADRATPEFERAVQEFRRVLIEYPRGDRVPTALYKRGLALIELEQPTLAEADFRFLIDQFPSTEEAGRAKEDLQRLRQR